MFPTEEARQKLAYPAELFPTEPPLVQEFLKKLGIALPERIVPLEFYRLYFKTLVQSCDALPSDLQRIFGELLGKRIEEVAAKLFGDSFASGVGAVVQERNSRLNNESP